VVEIVLLVLRFLDDPQPLNSGLNQSRRSKSPMLNRCANPECGKPLHYLREGKVFLFNVPDANSTNSPQREHFWLCGECSMAFSMIQQENQAASLVALPQPPQRNSAPSTQGVKRDHSANIAIAAAS
jgi:hypothetical protein